MSLPNQADGRYRSLDLWRGLACLLLVFYHCAFYVPAPFSPRDVSTWSVPTAAVKAAQLGWVGVPIFFVVSGYCIAASVNSLQRRDGSVRTFFVRRIRRIYPPLWVASAFVVLFAVAVGVFWPSLFEACGQVPRLGEFTIGNWIGNLAASESWQYHLTGSRKAFLMANTWTLCYEEQFYIVVGLLLAAARRRFFVGAIAVSAAVLAFRHAARLFDLDLHGWFVDGYWLAFALGILVFYQLNHAGRGARIVLPLVPLAAMLYAALDRWSTTAYLDRHLDEQLFIAGAFALALPALRQFDTAWFRSRIAQPLFWCGKHSYSIYLVHFPLVTALSCCLHMAGFDTPLLWLVCVVPSSLAVAVVSGKIFYMLIERHYQNAPAGESRAEQPAAVIAEPVLA